MRGFLPVEVQQAHKVPALAGQASNIVFVRESEASSWHGNKARRKN